MILIVYFIAGNVSQKMVPGVDEIFPFFGWSLFSRVPNVETNYDIEIHEHNRLTFDPPVGFLRAPRSLVTGNRFVAEKVVNSLGKAVERGRTAEVESLRRLLEENYLRGHVRYELFAEVIDPLERWRSGNIRERQSLASFEKKRRPRRVQ